MRIISGTHKGRRIVAPKKLPVRPTTDMAKEALFNVINNHFNFDKLAVLELFAGTGNISYKFASRGSCTITAVDADFGCVAFIKKTATELNLDITALKSDVFNFLERYRNSYDIIFADPPYNLGQENFEKIITTCLKNKLLKTKGMLIVEHSKDSSLEHIAQFSFSKRYGGTVFSFFQFENEENIEE